MAAESGFLQGVSQATRRAILELRRRIDAGPQVERGSWTPTLGNIAVGTGGSALNEAAYTWVGGTDKGDNGILYMNGIITFGTSGTTLPGASSSLVLVTIPTGFQIPNTSYYTSHELPGGLTMYDSSGSYYKGAVWYYSIYQFRFTIINTSGTYPTVGGFTTTTPFGSVWAAGDGFRWTVCVNAQRT